MVLIAYPDVENGVKTFGFRASGFVISRERRLVATAAHVADHVRDNNETVAILEATGQAYRIKRVWYHPVIIRELDKGLQINSSDPRDGDVVPGGTDTALLQLSDDGPEPPFALALADRKECHEILGRGIGLLGFPAGEDDPWPAPNHPPVSTFTTSVVGKTTDLEFRDHPSVSASERQCLWYRDLDFGAGVSGSPIFLANGHVVGVLSGGPFVNPSLNRYPDLGYRIDCLEELLAHHDLMGRNRVSIVTKQQRLASAPSKPLDELHRAVRFVREAESMRRDARYREAQAKCDAALAIAPQYGGALLERAKVSLHFLGAEWELLTLEQRRGYANQAADSIRECCRIYPTWIESQLLNWQTDVYLAILWTSPKWFKSVLADTTLMLEEPDVRWRLTTDDKAFLSNLRAQAHEFLDEKAAAEAAYDQSVTLSPREPRWYLNRAEFLEQLGRTALAQKDRIMAQQLERVAATSKLVTRESPPPRPPVRLRSPANSQAVTSRKAQ
jgi:tetratricopeptide (TPR) repeat protein